MLLNEAILFMSVEQLLAQVSGYYGSMLTSHSALCVGTVKNLPRAFP